jgi:hypothetical protein
MPTENQLPLLERATRVVLLLLALVTAAAAIWRMYDGSVAERVDETTLLYLGVAGAIVLLREVKSLAFKDYKVEFQRIENIAQDAKTTAQNAQSNAIGVGSGKNAESRPDEVIASESIAPGPTTNDPWKGPFGGKETANRRKLEADVLKIPGTSDLFSIYLCVSSTNSTLDPLRGAVQFFLHPTFKNDRPIVTVGRNGVAELKLTAWGAFTVGVLADEGRTKLELDLAELEDAPEEFRSR